MFNLSQDLHTHSTFSDGKNTIEENIKAAIQAGVAILGCADHVRKETHWLAEYVGEIQRLSKKYQGQIMVEANIEAKLLDEFGTLDIPQQLPIGIRRILVADHQFPLKNGCYTPEEIRNMLLYGQITPYGLYQALIKAYCFAMQRYPSVLIAHPFSILPKVGLSENDIPEKLLIKLAKCAVKTHTPIEISERWRCPNERTVLLLKSYGVQMPCSTDAHQKEAIGVYRYVKEMVGLYAAETTLT
jgi:putative hydrolase